MEAATLDPDAADVEYVSLTGTANTNIAIERDRDLTADGVIDQFLAPQAPRQPGPDTIADAVDSRPTDAIWQNNLMTFVSTRPCTPTGDSEPRDCVRVSQLNTTNVSSTVSPTLRQDFLIAENGKDNYMGGVGMAGNGTLHVVWTRSSYGDYPSSNAAYQLPSEAPNSISSVASNRPGEVLNAGTDATRGPAGATTSASPRTRRSRTPSGRPTSTRPADTLWKTYVSQLQTGRHDLQADHAAPGPRHAARDRPIGLAGAFAHGGPQLAGDRRRRPGIPADAVAVTGNLTVTNQTAAGYVSVTPTAYEQPAELDDQLPARRHPGQQPDHPALTDGQALGRLPAPRPARRPTSSST